MTLSLTPSLLPASGAASAPLSMAFNVVVSGGYGPYTYRWDFGDGVSAATAAGTHDYAAGRTYPVLLLVTDGLGDTATWSTNYVVHPALSVAFTATVVVHAGGVNDVTFVATCDLGTAPYTYAWSFGDGQTSTAASPVHTYAEAGSYTATLSVTDADGHVVMVSQLISITNALVVAIQATAEPVSGDAPPVINLTATASGGTPPYIYTWEFGDGVIGSGAAVTHTYPWSGTFLTKVGIVDSLGHDTSNSTVIAIVPRLTADPDRIPESGTPPFPVTFYSNVVGGKPPYTYQWDFMDGGTSTLENPVHSFLLPGYYNVVLVVIDSEGRTFSAVQAVQAHGTTIAPGAAPAITSPLTANASIGSPFSYRITGSNQPTSFDATGLPGSLTVNTITGLISGVLTDASSLNVTISATNVVGTGTATLVLSVVPAITSVQVVNAVIGTPLTYQITADNNPISFGATNLPDGLGINPSTGAITGTPTGIVHSSMHASNAAGTDTKSLTFSVTSSGGGGGDFLNGQEINLQQGLDDSFTVATTGGPLSFAFGTLPDGLTQVSTSGTITGLPTVYGDYTVSVDVTYSDHVSSGSMILHIAQAFAPVFTFPLDPVTWPEGVYLDFNLDVEANPLPNSWVISGAPSGINDYQQPSQHILYGTPYGAGAYTISISATNWAGTTTVDLPATVILSNFQVTGTSTSFDDIYEPAEEGYFALDYSQGASPAPVVQLWGPATPGPVRIYRSLSNSNLAIFYFETYQAWILEDLSTFSGGAPFAIYATDYAGSPPELSWPNSPYGYTTVTRL